MDKSEKILNVNVLINTVRDEKDKLIEGRVVFTSQPPKGWVQFLLDKGMSIPRVNCSRKGNNPDCNISIFELQIHNDHAPLFTNEDEMFAWLDRILQTTRNHCKILDITLKTMEGDEAHKLVATLHQGYEIKVKLPDTFCDDCGESDIEAYKELKEINGRIVCRDCAEKMFALGEALAEQQQEEQGEEGELSW